MSEPTWTTKEGKLLRIRNMETSHIKNAIAYFEDIPDDYIPDSYYDLIDELNLRESEDSK